MFNKYILQPFFNSAKIYSGNYAFCINGKFFSYSDLTEHIKKIRKAIQTFKTKSTNIGLVANDDIETYASIFAIWMEGFAYVPLHPQQPHERSEEIINQADIDLVIDSSVKSEFKTHKVINSYILTSCEINLNPKLIPDDALAYIIFTSGSTGKPKGVQITRKNISAFMKSFWEVGLKINQNDRCLQCFDLTFDVSVQSFLVPLTRGACVYTIPHNQIKYSYIFGLLEDHKITFGAMAPSMIRFLKPYFNEINLPGMRYNILTAEASPLDLITEWSECIPNSEIFDFYGPTEATIYCTYYKYIKGGTNKHLNGMICIGKPMRGFKAIVLDDEGEVLVENIKGELCISGDQVTPGYWNNAEKNAESFIEIIEEGIKKIYYKTGDYCYIDNDGDIMLSGRLDHQIKIQGYRVEPGEIEFYTREFLHGKSNIAVPFQNSSGNFEIVLVIEGNPFEITRLTKYLKSKLPSYMIPSKIRFIPDFPLNSSGKIDRLKMETLL
jgi:D-alanine--poly(phosphoribitol) ligase subunit 1